MADHLTAIAGIVAAGVACIGGAWASWRKWHTTARPFFDGIARALIVLNGRDAITLPESGEEVAPAVPGVLERVAAIEDRQDRLMVEQAKLGLQVKQVAEDVGVVKHEVQYNNGGSIKDAVDRSEAGIARLETAVGANIVRIGDIRSHVERVEQTVTDAIADRDQRILVQRESDAAMWSAIEAIAKANPPTPDDHAAPATPHLLDDPEETP